jgi:hypothetical protein
MYRTVRPRRAAHRKAHLQSRLLRHRGAYAARAAASAHRARQHADRVRRVRLLRRGHGHGPERRGRAADDAGEGDGRVAARRAQAVRARVPYPRARGGRHLSWLLPSGATPLQVAFTPALTPWFSGSLALACVPLAAPLAARDVRALFEARYKGERLVRLQRDAVVLSDVERRHGVCVGGVQV